MNATTDGPLTSFVNTQTGVLTPITPNVLTFDGIRLTSDRHAAVSTRLDNRGGSHYLLKKSADGDISGFSRSPAGQHMAVTLGATISDIVLLRGFGLA